MFNISVQWCKYTIVGFTRNHTGRRTRSVFDQHINGIWGKWDLKCICQILQVFMA